MFFDTDSNDHGLPYNPFKAVVTPRPIAWVSTLSEEGTRNLAPYSFFNAVGYYPPLVMFASGGRPPVGRMKDSMRNVIATGEFVVNIVPHALRHEMNLTAEEVAPQTDEFAHAGLEAAPSRLIKPPRVALSPAAMECRLVKVVDLPGRGMDAEAKMAIGHVVGMHIDDAVIDSEGRFDILKVRPLARLGYMDYTSVDHVFAMFKPLSDDDQGVVRRTHREGEIRRAKI